MKKKNKVQRKRFMEDAVSCSNQPTLLLSLILLFLTWSLSNITFSASEKINADSAKGIDAEVSIILCLNAKGPLTCQRFKVPILSSDLNIRIRTTPPNRFYPIAGIKVEDPRYSLLGCTRLNNGYCMFSVGDQNPAFIKLI